MQDSIKFGIVSAVWQRPEIFKLFARGLHDLIKAHPQHEFKVFIAGSEGDTSRQIVTDEGFNYIEHPNEPLGAKHNSAALAAKDYHPNFLFCLGSDDLIHPQAFGLYLKKLETDPDIDIMGFSDFYFYDMLEEQAFYWNGYTGERKGGICGAGTLLSRRLLDLWSWRPWSSRLNSRLDGSLQAKLRITIPRPKSHTFSLRDEGLVCVDLKSDTNMTSPETLIKHSDIQIVPKATILNDFPYVSRTE